MKEMLEAAKAAKGEVAGLTTEQKNAALNAMADALLARQDAILDANALDMASAKEHISPVMLDRLKLTKERIAGMAQGIREVTALPDPVGRVLQTHIREDGLEIQKVSVPMGVIAIIYESRPNVTSDAAALALKSGKFWDETLQKDGWSCDPARTDVRNFPQMICLSALAGDPASDSWFRIRLYLRPWGVDWSDVRTGDVSGCWYEDMMPPGYDSWYARLLAQGTAQMPDSFGEGWALLREGGD